MGANDVDAIISRALRQNERSIQLTDEAGREAAQDLINALTTAEASLRSRLEDWMARHEGEDVLFTEASLRSYIVQSQASVAYVQERLRGIVAEQAERVALETVTRNHDMIRRLEREFTGVVIPPRSREAVIARVRPSLIDRHATSIDRYGDVMTRRIMSEIGQGFVEGISQGQMVDRLVNLRGPRGLVSLRAVEVQPGMVIRTLEKDIPEGLFVRHRQWAWRVVRTEVAEAQNAVSQEQVEQDAERDMPDMQRKIIAIMDIRTAQDSIGVHGQVRGPREKFRDGAGREYLRPPSRPNDRETIIPWRPHWDETRATRPLSATERDEMWERNQAWQRERNNRRQAIRRAKERAMERAEAQ